MRKTSVVWVTAIGALLFGIVPAGLAHAKVLSRRAADQLVCNELNHGRPVKGVCVLPEAALGETYEAFILTSAGDGGTFMISSGSLPPGTLMPSVFGAAGTIVGGVPTQEGTFTFTVKGVDNEGNPLKQTYRIKVGAPEPLTDTTESQLPRGAVGQAYAANFFLSGGLGPYTWSLTAGKLPAGLQLISTDAPEDNDNQLAGTPTAAGTFTFTITVTDSLGHTAAGKVHVTIEP